MKNRDIGKLVFEHTLDYQTGAQGFGRLIHRRDDIAANLNPGALIYKAEALPGPTIVVLYCNDKYYDAQDREVYTAGSVQHWFARWDSDKTIVYPRDFDVSISPNTFGRYQFYPYDYHYSPGDCPQEVFKTRLRPASGENDVLRIYMNAALSTINNDDFFDPSSKEPHETLIKPEWTACAIQLGGKTFKKTFVPSYRYVYEAPYWFRDDVTDNDLAVSLNFNGRGELVSLD